MAGSFLIGFLLSSGLWLLIPLLIFTYHSITALAEWLGHRIFLHQDRTVRPSQSVGRTIRIFSTIFAIYLTILFLIILL